MTESGTTYDPAGTEFADDVARDYAGRHPDLGGIDDHWLDDAGRHCYQFERGAVIWIQVTSGSAIRLDS